MKSSFLLLVLFLAFLPVKARKQKFNIFRQDKDHTVQWDFFCTNGMNSGKWSKIDVPSNWELQGFGSYLYGNVNRKLMKKGYINMNSMSLKTGKRKK